MTKEGENLLDVFQYGYWVVLLSDEDKDFEMMVTTKKKVRVLVLQRDFMLEDYRSSGYSCVVIRPDFFVAYAGESKKNQQLLSLLKWID